MRSSVAERQLPKLNMRVRFPSRAPAVTNCSDAISGLFYAFFAYLDQSLLENGGEVGLELPSSYPIGGVGNIANVISLKKVVMVFLQ